MLLPNVFTGIVVSVEAVATRTTEEEALRTTIVAGLMSTLATGLARVSRINFLDTNTTLLCFVGSEVIELGKCPTMQTPFVLDVLVGFATSHVRGFSNVRQVLKDIRCASR